MLSRFAISVVNNRRRLPKWAQSMLNAVSQQPYSLVSKIATFAVRGPSAEPTTVPATPIRVYIAPTNYAGQGALWARALEAADPGIGARNVAVRVPGGFAFPADTSVSMWEATHSRNWADAEWARATQFTHVLVEAERPMFGARFRGNVVTEVQALRAQGVSVAFLAHGTDVRDPHSHRTAEPLSPYRLDPRTPFLEEQAVKNRHTLEVLGGPQFVSTPDLLADVPSAKWCPVVIDPHRFVAARAPLSHAKPRVIHISSDPIQKGSDLVAEAMAPLFAAGRVDFQIIEGVPSADIPGILADADIVLDQFRLGSYGVAACEAMAAGRIVIGNVSDTVRRIVRAETQYDLPIVQARPAELAETIERIVGNRDEYIALASESRSFAQDVHSGHRSAQVLLEHWVRRSEPVVAKTSG